MAFTEDLYIYKDTLLLCKILLKYSNSVSRTVRFTTYNEAVVKSCTALDLVRRINESWENREERMHDYILLMSEVKSRISLLTDAEFLNKKQATNLNMMSDKVLKEVYGWRKSERKRKGENCRVNDNARVPSLDVTRGTITQLTYVRSEQTENRECTEIRRAALRTLGTTVVVQTTTTSGTVTWSCRFTIIQQWRMPLYLLFLRGYEI